jgi:NADPH2:quinone reductase
MTAMDATAWVVTRLSAPTEALEIQTVEIGDPGVNQVRINVEAFCLDFNDIDTIRGRYGLLKFEPPFVVGMAAAGTVEAAGPGCEVLLGRRVVGVASGAHGSAGINRQRGRNERVLHRRSSEPR